MANRTFKDKQMSLLNRLVWLYGVFTVGETGTPTLQKWVYPTLGTGTNVRTYTAAATSAAPPSGTGPYPLQYTAGTEGIRSVARTGVGLWTITLQDNYQRLVGLSFFTRVAGGLGNIVAIHENTTISNMSSGGGSIIGVALLSSTATAADPTSGHTLVIRFDLQDATEP